MWRENQSGEWYWPLHPERQQDHLRVWFLGVTDPAADPNFKDPSRGWYGALVLDGEYLDPTRVGPYATAGQAREAIYRKSREYVLKMAGGLRR